MAEQRFHKPHGVGSSTTSATNSFLRGRTGFDTMNKEKFATRGMDSYHVNPLTKNLNDKTNNVLSFVDALAARAAKVDTFAYAIAA